jgi:phospholipid transport system substrate-binding protein
MVMQRILVLKIILLIGLLTPHIVTAAQLKPLEELRPPFDKVIAILNDPKYKTDEALKSEQRDQIWKAVDVIFDFEEVSKRALARNWRKFSDSEKKKFTDVFGTFLGNTYMDKIQGEYHNEKIVYGDEKIIDDKWALVRTKIKREALEIPVDYKMKLIDGHWKVYDVVIESVSLIKNYRTQFNTILKKQTPAQLIERLEKKSVGSN